MRGFYFKCSQEDKAEWEAAAKLAGLSLSAWIKSRLADAESISAKAANDALSDEASYANAWRCKCGWNNFRSECTQCGRSRKFAVKEK